MTVQALDGNGNVATGFTDNVTMAIGNNAGGGTLSGNTTVAAAAGLATLSNLSLNKAGTGYTLTAAATGLTGAASGAFNITPGGATQLTLTTQPSANAQGGVAFPQQPVAQLRDAQGNAVTQPGVGSRSAARRAPIH